MSHLKAYVLLCASFFLWSCAGSVVNYSSPIPIDCHSKIAVIPFSNYTETPLAGERAMSIAAATIESDGFFNVLVYQKEDKSNAILLDMSHHVSRPQLIEWAKMRGARYVMTGSVNEWTYKVGLDGEPAVGLSLQLIDVSNQRIIWTAVGSRSGHPRMALSTVAQQLMNMMLNKLLKPGVRNA